MASEVSQKIRFECCYIVDTDINAHEYQFEATVVNMSGESKSSGRIIDFANLKELMEKIVPNNRFLFDTTNQNLGRDVAFLLGQRGLAITGYAFSLSAENICRYLGDRLQKSLDAHYPGVNVKSVRLRENSSSYATWYPDFTISM